MLLVRSSTALNGRVLLQMWYLILILLLPMLDQPTIAEPVSSAITASPRQVDSKAASLPPVRSIKDWKVENTVLLATIDGGLFARDRETGAARWSVYVDSPMIQTTYNRTNATSTERSAAEDFLWIVEPTQDGALYMYRPDPMPLLQKLGITVRTLAEELSPHARENPPVVYTASKQNTLYTIDAKTGTILQVFSSAGTANAVERPKCPDPETGSQAEETCGSEGTISMGRIEYTVNIQSRTTQKTICQLKYWEWSPNTRDDDLQRQYSTTTIDSKYFYSSYDGGILGFDHSKTDDRLLFTEKLSSPVVRVFDIIRPVSSEPLDYPLVLLPQPTSPTELPFHPQIADEEVGNVFVNCTEQGSWYAMSELAYPLVTNKASAAACYHTDAQKAAAQTRGTKDDPTESELVGVHRTGPIGLDGYLEVQGIGGSLGPLTIDSPPRSLALLAPIASAPLLLILLLSLCAVRKKLGFGVGYPWDEPEAQAILSRRDESAYRVLESGTQVETSPLLDRESPLNETLTAMTESATEVLVADGDLIHASAPAAPDEEHDRAQEQVVHSEILEAEQDALGEPDLEPDADSGAPLVGPDDTTQEATATAASPGAATIIAATSLSNDGVPPRTPTSLVDEMGDDDAPEGSPRDVHFTTSSAMATSPAPTKPRKRGGRGGKKKSKKPQLSDMATEVEAAAKEAPVDDQATPTGPRPIEPDLNDLVVFNDQPALGYGSHGTVVYRGRFGGREVAVKRMLLEYFDMYSHEVSLLQVSDDHPNVIRYFCRQQNAGFLYIALELCPATLQDVVEKPSEHLDLVPLMDTTDVLFQITMGVRHLHSLKIVHRDLKPQNILVTEPQRSRTSPPVVKPPKVLISDFGLCKKLEGEQSSFRATTAHAAGTSGWRAPELLLDDDSSPNQSSHSQEVTTRSSLMSPTDAALTPNRRATRAIDIFSLGCVFFYVLTSGLHPFGDKYSREMNIIRSASSMGPLDALGTDAAEAKDLISAMLAHDPRARPDANAILVHPFFWSSEKRLNFLVDVSDHFEFEPRDPPSPALSCLESGGPAVIGTDFLRKLDLAFVETLGKQRKYTGSRMLDLLRALRNKKNHYQDMPEAVRGMVGPLPDGYSVYWRRRFPHLVLHCWTVIREIGIQDYARFRVYFSPPD